MAILIQANRLTPNHWRLPDAEPDAAQPTQALLTLVQWHERVAAEKQGEKRGETPVGVLLEPSDDPSVLAGDLVGLALIAVRFPQFSDGRGYSIARLLRERYGWTGELRAVGDVLRDQIFYLARCGFDAFELRDDQDAEQAIAALRDFTEAYQAAADRGPLFERRLAMGIRS